jgi:hypothetical protein
MNKNIIEKIPTAWKDVKVKDYQKLSEIVVTESGELDNLFVGIDNSIKVLSAFTGMTVEELEALPMNEVTQMSKRLDFMLTLPEINKKSIIKWKKLEEITYNDFILFNQFGNDFFKNLHLLIPAFSKTKISEEEVLDMNLEDMHTAFFFLRKHVIKSLKRTVFYSKVKMKNQQIAEKMIKLVYKQK